MRIGEKPLICYKDLNTSLYSINIFISVVYLGTLLAEL